ncbi:MAG: hypothetical protein JWR00_3355, partial [Rubritepida sp.]|nr:hypothetical protein [Rubritepida sp.]
VRGTRLRSCLGKGGGGEEEQGEQNAAHTGFSARVRPEASEVAAESGVRRDQALTRAPW